MDDFSSIIGIVIAIIIFAVSALRKKNNAANKDGENRSDILEALLGGFEEQPEPAISSHIKRERYSTIYRDDQEEYVNPEMAEEVKIKVPNIPSRIKKQTNSMKYKKKNTFNLRKAIIYSEIMNRKYE